MTHEKFTDKSGGTPSDRLSEMLADLVTEYRKAFVSAQPLVEVLKDSSLLDETHRWLLWLLVVSKDWSKAGEFPKEDRDTINEWLNDYSYALEKLKQVNNETDAATGDVDRNVFNNFLGKYESELKNQSQSHFDALDPTKDPRFLKNHSLRDTEHKQFVHKTQNQQWIAYLNTIEVEEWI